MQSTSFPNTSLELKHGQKILEIQSLTIGYQRFRQANIVIAEDINQSLVAGEMICLIGPNGAGKSTLLRTISGLQPALNGQVHLMNRLIGDLSDQELARLLSIVLTERISVGLLRGRELVALGRYPYTSWVGNLTRYDKAVIEWAIEAVGAQTLADRHVNELSDGERQKIMIARALAQDPSLMILDEPTAYLDLPRRVEIMHLLKRLARETTRSVLLSTHDLDLALRHADRIWLLSSSGKLTVGAPEDLVLSGAFEATFRSEGLTFDPYSGAFKIDIPPQKSIQLIAKDLPYQWMSKALERNGYSLSEQSDITISFVNNTWEINTSDNTNRYDSIYDILQHLQQLN